MAFRKPYTRGDKASLASKQITKIVDQIYTIAKSGPADKETGIIVMSKIKSIDRLAKFAQHYACSAHDYTDPLCLLNENIDIIYCKKCDSEFELPCPDMVL